MTDLKRKSRQSFGVGGVLACVGMLLLIVAGGQMLNAAWAERTEGVVTNYGISGNWNAVTVRFSFHGRTYEEARVPDGPTVRPGDKVALRVYRGYRGMVMS